ncbi:MAG TPA: YraN family protein [Longimicrobiales bacterium]|nr:YraN family protein [Longimicrobiales bacterium]
MDGTSPHPPQHPPHALGRRGEARAAAYLERHGWTILARNYRFGRREVDLVARKGSLVAFVEVKTRGGMGYGAPQEAVTRLKRREIEIVAQDFLFRHCLGDVEVRFDVLSIVAAARGGAGSILHIEDAWRPDPPR